MLIQYEIYLELLRITQMKKYIEDVLVELRELKDDSYQQDEFQEVISVMSKEKNYVLSVVIN